MENTNTKTEETLHEIAAYLRIIAASSVKQRAGEVINKWQKAMVYDKMDGNTSQQKIATAIGVPQRTVANWADEFLHYHLAVPPSVFNSSHKALFSLEELNVDVSSLKKQYSKTAAEQPSTPIEGATVEGDQNGTTNTQ
jgi:hypothetical protein